MKKFLKVVLLILVCLVLFISIGGYIFLKQIDLNKYKGWIEEKVAAETGRELVIGNIQIKPSLSPTVELQNVSFANASWAEDKNMASVGAIDVGVAILPLLHKSYVISKFVVKNAVINLQQRADGTANWTFDKVEKNTPKAKKTSSNFRLIKNAYAEGTAEVKDNSIEDLLNKLTIKRVMLEDVKINYIDKTSKVQSYDIKKFALDENKDGNIDFDVDVNDGLYQGKGTVGYFKLLSSKSGYPIKADVNVMGINVITDVMLFDALNNLRFDGNIKAKGFFGQDSSYNESADVAVKGDLHKIDVAFNSVKVAGNVVVGKANVDLDTKVPTVTADFNSEAIDIASFAKKQSTAWNISLIKKAEATTVVPAQAIPYDVLSKVNADIDIHIGKILNKKAMIAENLVMNAKINDNKAMVKITDGTFAKGNAKANMVLNGASKSLSLNMDVVKVNLLDLMKSLDMNSNNFYFIDGGITDLYVKLSGKGSTYASVVDSLDGQVAFIVDKSSVHLGNVAVMADLLYQLFSTLKLTEGNDDLAMKCAVVRADLKDGLVTFPDGIVVNADKFTVIGHGKINLKDDKISIGIKPFGGKLTDTNIAKALSSLFRVTGTLQKPAYGIDTANVVKNVVGATMTGPVYLGAQMVMESDNSPCYTALKDTGYETRFPKSDNIAKTTSDDVGKALDGGVDAVKDTAKGLFNILSGKIEKKDESK